MMGPRQVEQGALFYNFSIDAHVPADHLLRSIDRFVDLSELRRDLAPFYSTLGRPSIDPELIIRMLIVGYCFGIRSERRLCEEVHLNLAYRWFCRLGLDGDVPDHSTFSKNRHGRFRESDLLRRVFDTVLQHCIGEGLVGGEGFAVDASLIKADANRQKGIEGEKGLPPEATGRAVQEYLAVLDDAAFGAATEVTPKFISPADPAARWHLLRSSDRFVDLSELRRDLAPFYSTLGRPSIDPELIIRMLIVGYCFGIRSERRLCEEVHLNLAYRWFCRLGLDGDVPDHSTFSKNRHGRFRESDLLRRVFDTVLQHASERAWVGGEGFAVDASLIKADANRQKGIEGEKGLPPEATGRAVQEYLAVLDDAAFGAATEVTPKFISPADPAARSIDRSIMRFAARTSAWRIAVVASTSTMIALSTSIR